MMMMMMVMMMMVVIQMTTTQDKHDDDDEENEYDDHDGDDDGWTVEVGSRSLRRTLPRCVREKATYQTMSIKKSRALCN